MREPSIRDAWLGLRLYELRRDGEMRKARNMVGSHVMNKTWEEVEALLDYAHPENAHFRQVTSYFEMAASFVNRGIFHPDVFLDTCGEGIFMWVSFEPFLEKIRAKGRPTFLGQTEAVIKAHPQVAQRVVDVRKRVRGN